MKLLTNCSLYPQGLKARLNLSVYFKLLKRRRDVMTSANILFYESSKQELLVDRAEGQYMFDEEGNRYLDLINNVAHG